MRRHLDRERNRCCDTVDEATRYEKYADHGHGLTRALAYGESSIDVALRT
jgi:hypothetical protein